MSFTELDLNAWPVWGILVIVALLSIPRIIQGFAPFFPSLAAYLKHRGEAAEEQTQREEGREDTKLHWQMETQGLQVAQSFKAMETLIEMLEQSLANFWEGRADSLATLQKLSNEVQEYRYQMRRLGDTMGLHGQNIAKLADDIEELNRRLGNLPERVASLGAVLMGDDDASQGK